MELIDEVLLALGYTLDTDEEIKHKILGLIEAVKGFLEEGGAKNIGSTKLEITCISIGVNDLLNCESGKTKFSPAFHLIANQICR